MTKIREIAALIEEFAPLSLQESYDNAGLLTGDAYDEVKAVMICLDCTEEVLEEAMEKGCNLIIAHHPLIFGGLKRLTGRNYVERTVIKAIRNKLAIYAAHTNLDNVHQGVNAVICSKLGLQNTAILAPKSGLLRKLTVFCPEDQADKVRQAIFSAGGGGIGNYDHCSFNAPGTGTFRANALANPFIGEAGVEHHEKEIRVEVLYPVHSEGSILKAMKAAHPYEEVAYDIVQLSNAHQQIGSGMSGVLPEPMDEMEFLKYVKEIMKCHCIRYTGLLGKKVSKVAVCGGSGSFLLDHAIAAGNDVFISGDFKYHQFFDADKKILIADIGHYESEQFTMELFSQIISEKFRNFAVHLTKSVTNPINYL